MPIADLIINHPEFSECLDDPPLIVVQAEDEPDNKFRLGTREYDWHHHLYGQLFCVENGLVHIRTKQGSWLLPPNRAGWIPAYESHKISISGAINGWAILITSQTASVLPSQPCVIGISALMTKLIHRTTSWSFETKLTIEQERIILVLLDEIKRAPHEPLHLRIPTDRRLLRITNGILSQLDNKRTLQAWAAWAGLSPSTLSRLFLAETGNTFSQWRQQARLTHALEMLADGHSVADVSYKLGYATPSNFIAMFRRSFGDSPAHYFSNKRNVNI